MSLTKVQIISNALGLLGQAPIISLVAPTPMVQSAEQCFDFLLNAELSSGQWRFAACIRQLNQLVQTPITSRWQYIYQMPADLLKVIGPWPIMYDWEIYENNRIYSNSDNPFYLEYVYQVPVERLPDYFNRFFIYDIANYLALSSAQKPEYIDKLTPARDYYYAVALAIDAQNRPQTALVSQPILTLRQVAGITGVSG